MQKQTLGATLLLLATSLVSVPAMAGGESGRQTVRSPAAEEARHERAMRMAEELGLSDTQREQIKAIMAESRRRAGEIHRQTVEQRRVVREEMLALRNETRDKVHEVLTEEQRQQLVQLREEREADGRRHPRRHDD